MGVLTVRGVDDELIRALRVRAATNGRPVEAEHLAILREALTPKADHVVELLRRRRESLAGRNFSDNGDILRRQRAERAGR